MAKASALATVFLSGSLLTLVGCLSLRPLEERNFDEVTLAHAEKAGTQDENRKAFEGLIGLLETRLEDPDRVDLDVALEALVSLGRIGDPEAFSVVERCAQQGHVEDVRYVALDTLLALDRERARPVLEGRARDDESVLVREHAQELLKG